MATKPLDDLATMAAIVQAQSLHAMACAAHGEQWQVETLRANFSGCPEELDRMIEEAKKASADLGASAVRRETCPEHGAAPARLDGSYCECNPSALEVCDKCSIVAHSDPQHITKTVHEHRAPTDESIRLLNEMEAKAMANVISKLTPPGNVVSGIIVEHAHMGLERCFTVAFELNGHKFNISQRMNNDLLHLDPASAWKSLFDEIAKAIASELFERVFASSRKV